MSFSSYVSDAAFNAFHDLNYYFQTLFPAYDVN
jgi:hypothetical protein